MNWVDSKKYFPSVNKLSERKFAYKNIGMDMEEPELEFLKSLWGLGTEEE